MHINELLQNVTWGFGHLPTTVRSSKTGRTETRNNRVNRGASIQQRQGRPSQTAQVSPSSPRPADTGSGGQNQASPSLQGKVQENKITAVKVDNTERAELPGVANKFKRGGTSNNNDNTRVSRQYTGNTNNNVRSGGNNLPSQEESQRSSFSEAVKASNRREQASAERLQRTKEFAPNFLQIPSPSDERSKTTNTGLRVVRSALGTVAVAPFALGEGVAMAGNKLYLTGRGLLESPENTKQELKRAVKPAGTVTKRIATFRDPATGEFTPESVTDTALIYGGAGLYGKTNPLKLRDNVKPYKPSFTTKSDPLTSIKVQETTQKPIKPYNPQFTTKYDPLTQIKLQSQQVDTPVGVPKFSDLVRERTTPKPAESSTLKLTREYKESLKDLRQEYRDPRYGRDFRLDALEESSASLKAQRIIQNKQAKGKIDSTGRRLTTVEERKAFFKLIEENRAKARLAEEIQKRRTPPTRNNLFKDKRGSSQLLKLEPPQTIAILKKPGLAFPLVSLGVGASKIKSISQVPPRQRPSTIPLLDTEQEKKTSPSITPVVDTAVAAAFLPRIRTSQSSQQAQQFEIPSLSVTESQQKPSFPRGLAAPSGGFGGGGSSGGGKGKQKFKYTPSIKGVNDYLSTGELGKGKSSDTGYSGLEERQVTKSYLKQLKTSGVKL